MYLVHRLAGFTLGEGDMLRRALEKNKKADIDKWRERFKANCKYPDQADELFDWIGANAAYLFNRSHALTYSLIGYWCSFYKANYPEAFLVANLRHPKGNAEYSEPEYIQAFIQEAREMGVTIELPQMGNCYPITTLVGKTVYYGLTGIKGISDSSASPLASVIADNLADFGRKTSEIKKEHLVNGKVQSRALVNKAHIRQLVKIGFFGDPAEIIKEFNQIYKEDVTVESYEDAINDAVGFNWFSPLEKYYEKLETRYRDKDNYMLMKITSKKPGSTNGRDWCMLKGETIMGQITVFLEKPSQGSSIKAKDVVISSYKRNPKKDSITFIDCKLLD